MWRWIGAAALALLVAGPAQAEVYKCEIGGKVAFQDQPCTSGSQSAFQTPAMEERQKREAAKARKEQEWAKERLQQKPLFTQEFREGLRWQPAPDENTLEYRVGVHLRHTAHNPDSIEVANCSSVEKNATHYRIVCNYRGANSFGAKILKQSVFMFTHDYELVSVSDL